jgi:hypothetical protein
VRLYFGLVLTAFVVTTLVGAPLSWDGSYVLFSALDTQGAFIPHGRLPDHILQAPLLAAARFTSDMNVLKAAFSLTYTLVPLLSLAASWWLVRRRAPALFLWPALGIGLVALPGQFCFVSEAIMAAELGWPLVLAMLLGVRRWDLLLVPLVAVVFLLHMVSAVVLLTAAVAGAVMLIRPDQRSRLSVVLVVALASLSIARLLVPLNSYEQDMLSAAAIGWAWSNAVPGAPAGAVILALVAGGAAIYATRLLLGGQTQPATRLGLLAVGAVAGAGVVLLFWALDPQMWARAIGYRWWVALFGLPFMAGALLERLLGTGGPLSGYKLAITGRFPDVDRAALERYIVNLGGRLRRQVVEGTSYLVMGDAPGAKLERAHRLGIPIIDLGDLKQLAHSSASGCVWSSRLRIVQASAAVFSGVLVAQSVAWVSLSNSLAQDVAQSSTSCVPTTALSGIRNSALDSWVLPSYTLVLQGRAPRVLVQDGDGCSQPTLATQIRVTPWDVRPREGGWFHLSQTGLPTGDASTAERGL